jgi:hypothetical protein
MDEGRKRTLDLRLHLAQRHLSGLSRSPVFF